MDRRTNQPTERGDKRKSNKGDGHPRGGAMAILQKRFELNALDQRVNIISFEFFFPEINDLFSTEKLELQNSLSLSKTGSQCPMLRG